MKKGLLLILLFVFFVSTQNAFSQEQGRDKKPIAQQIRQYWFVMLLKGNNRSQDSATAAKIQQGHLANIERLYKEGKIKIAGPFGDDGDWLGLFVFDCPTKDEVISLLQTDPAVAAGRLSYDIRPWYTVPTGSFKPGKPDTTAPGQ